MRILLAVPLLLVGACNVSKDEANNTVSATFNQDEAANTVNDISNGVQNVAHDVGNEASNLSNKVQNTDLDVKVNQDVKTENKSR